MKVLLFFNFLVLTINNFIHPISPELLEMKQAPLYLNGILYSMMALASFLFSPLWGKLMTKRGIKLFLVIGPVTYAIVQWGFYLFDSPILIGLSRFLAGVTSSMFIVGVSSYVSLYSPASKRGKYFGLITATTSLGAIFGQFLSGEMAKYSLELPFIVLLIAATVIAILIIFFIKDDDKQEEGKEKQSIKNIFNILKQSKQIKLLAIFVLITFSANIYNSNIGLFVQSYYDLAPNEVARVTMIGNTIILLVNLFCLNYLQNKCKFNTVITTMIVIGLISCGGIILSLDSKLFIVFISLFVLSYAAYRPIMQAEFLVNNKLSAPMLMGFLNSINSLAMISGGLISGIAYSINPVLMFYIILLLLASALVLMKVKR